MNRIDHDLAFILRYENVAWYEDGVVRILDRRIYPIRTEFVTCKTHQEVAQAIADMVTQSGGPYAAAAMGMALAAYEASSLGTAEFTAYMQQAAHTLSHARPTTSAKMVAVVQKGLLASVEAKEAGRSAVDAAFEAALDYLNAQYARTQKMGRYLADRVPNGGSVMTQCWAETAIGMLLRSLKEQNKDNVKFYCPETRPYFQGGRLTASCIADTGFNVTVITDNMPGYVMREKGLDLFTSAADVICLDGTIVNKVGTFQIALCANYFGIPYYVTGTPNNAHSDVGSVIIEERDPELVLHALDQKFTFPGVKGYYPAFDITPPELCSGYVTAEGVFRADELRSIFG